MILFSSIKKTLFSEIGIILVGSALVVLLIISSYFISQKNQKDNLDSFQNTIRQNLQYQYLLLNMSNSIRDRMLVVHDINLSSDPFEIDEYKIEFQTIAVEFIKARELLLQLNLPKKQINRLGALRLKLNKVRDKLQQIINVKTDESEIVFQDILVEAREVNKIILVEIKKLIDIQLENAQKSLNKANKKNEKSNRINQWVNLAAFFISIIIVYFILKILKLRKAELNKVLLDLEKHNKNLETVVADRTGELVFLQKESSKINAEIEVNRQLQEFIVPNNKELREFKNIDIATYVEAAEEMGGDYVDVLSYRDGQLICIGDVTDHGLMSGIIMLMTQSIIRHQSNQQTGDLKHALNNINLSLFQNIQRMKSERHLSLSLLYLNGNNLTVTGQHEAIIIVRKGGVIEKIETDDLGFYIGFVEDIEPFTNSIDLTLNKDDLVLLHTDGITEAANAKEELYGFDRLCEQAIQHKDDTAYNIIHNIIGDMNRFVGAKALYDDVALIAFKIT